MLQQCFDVSVMLVFSIISGGIIGFTMDRLSYHDDIMFNPRVVARKRVLITGASSGLGETIAYQYARNGANLFITARTSFKLKEIADECRLLGAASVHQVDADLIRMVDAEKVIKLATKALGGLDHVVLSHSYSPSYHYWTGNKQDMADIQMTFDMNVKSYIHLATHALQELRKSNGSLGIINYMTAKTYAPLAGLTSMAHHALDGFFSSLRLEIIQQKINVSITHFIMGDIDTPRRRTELEQAERELNMNFLKSFEILSPASETALVVIRGLSKRQSEIYHPPSQDVKLRTLLRDWLPHTSYISLQ